MASVAAQESTSVIGQYPEAQRVALDISELSTVDATAQAELVRRKEVTPLELVDPAIARIERVNPHSTQ